MDNLKAEVVTIISKAVPTLNPTQVNALVDFLFSPEVMVQSLDDLKEIDESMLAGKIGALPLKKIIRAFKGERGQSALTGTQQRSISQSESQSEQEPGTSDQTERPSQRQFRNDDFQYEINWNDMPKKPLKALIAARNANKEGEASDITLLKNAIAEKIVINYRKYKLTHPGAQKCPGINVCESAAKQVLAKLGIALQESIKTVVFGTGLETMTQRLSNKTENDTRTDPSSKATTSGVSKGKGVPGVIPREYLPPMTKTQRRRQELCQRSLQDMTLLDEDERDWPDIADKMNETFELQRELIVTRTKEIVNDEVVLGDETENSEDEDEDGDGDGDGDEDDPPPPLSEKAVAVIKDKWPFLFSLRPMNNHHKRLTGRDLDAKLTAFLSDPDNLNYLVLFLTSSSNANILNVSLKLQVEKRNESLTCGATLLVAVCMLANHFKETYNGTLLLTAEITTMPDEIIAAVPDLPSSACIVALGQNAFHAEMFYICIDKICVAETSNAGNALLMLVELCFILDLQYPEGLSRTFEYVERMIFEMTPQQTRVRDKKGKILLVLTEAVRSTGKKLVAFTNQVKENLRAENNLSD